MKAVYTLADLCDRQTLDAGADKPAKLAVLGYPIKHSASPQMHQAALDELDIDCRYIRLEVEPGMLNEAIDRMRQLGFIGCNVTVPHKQEAFENCTQLSDDARALGVCNTLTFSDDGVHGHNTDGPGLLNAIKDDFGVELKDLKVLIVGAGGGAGKAIATQCARAGCPQLTLANRTVAKVEAVRDELIQQLQLDPANIHAVAPTDSSFGELVKSSQLIINATSLGLKSDDPLPMDAQLIDASQLVYDAIYNPPVTSLMAAAAETGCKTSNGLSMLVHQGALAFETWFGQQPNTKLMKSAIL
ncbi:shikimate dehydrogenase [Persicirhabdus sediminis]|uniref:Shikimate dehydrogenase (NADP(+)) n=1 Tax=Persicirhabdus sediminis TaxID=454144 RepID=A0A8J7SHB2_9BACT|nr:shikimate dehydrogenase [Persicirhabdus sediminis]MBK1790680.1 shikimate dehydrogenase [Persicirhabdus sediminis]